jgi:hypothetical protein
MKDMLHILLIEDDNDDIELIQDALMITKSHTN